MGMSWLLCEEADQALVFLKDVVKAMGWSFYAAGREVFIQLAHRIMELTNKVRWGIPGDIKEFCGGLKVENGL